MYEKEPLRSVEPSTPTAVAVIPWVCPSYVIVPLLVTLSVGVAGSMYKVSWLTVLTKFAS